MYLPLITTNCAVLGVTINNIIDTSPDGDHWCTFVLGEADSAYGENLVDSMKNITISNVVCNANDGILIDGYLTDSLFSNIINKRKDTKTFGVARENGLKNVKFENIISGE